MKILITTDAYKPMINGVVISVMNLREQLEKRGHEVRILALSDTRRPRKEDGVYYMRSFSVPVYPEARATLSFRSEYVKEILRWRPDLVHSQSEFTSFHLARIIAKKLDIPMIHTYHTMYEDYTHYFLKNKWMGKKVVAKGSYLLLRKMDVIITPTKKVSDALREYGIKRRMVTIPTGIDLDKFQKEYPQRIKEDIRRDLGLSKEDKVLLFVGRVGKEKNIDFLIREMKRLTAEDPCVHLVVVGDGPQKPELEGLAEEEGVQKNVHFTGAVPPAQVPKYYAFADLFVNASKSETQGLTYIEALASGLPAVCMADDCLEGVITDGYNGYLVHNPEEFFKNIQKILNNPELNKEMERNARESAKRYSKEAFGQEVEKLYQFVLLKEKRL